MKKIFAARARRHQEGATAVEYGLIAGIVAVGIVVILGSMGGSLNDVFSTVGDKLDEASTSASAP